MTVETTRPAVDGCTPSIVPSPSEVHTKPVQLEQILTPSDVLNSKQLLLVITPDVINQFRANNKQMYDFTASVMTHMHNQFNDMANTLLDWKRLQKAEHELRVEELEAAREHHAAMAAIYTTQRKSFASTPMVVDAGADVSAAEIATAEIGQAALASTIVTPVVTPVEKPIIQEEAPPTTAKTTKPVARKRKKDKAEDEIASDKEAEAEEEEIDYDEESDSSDKETEDAYSKSKHTRKQAAKKQRKAK